MSVRGKIAAFLRGLLKVLAAATVGSLTLLGLVVVLALGTLGTEAGTRGAISRGLRLYNGMIPGAITVRRTSGALLTGLAFEGVALLDRDGHPIIDADSVSLHIDPSRLLSGVVRVTKIDIAGARVFFRYLAMTGSRWISILPQEQFGPHLPLRRAVMTSRRTR